MNNISQPVQNSLMDAGYDAKDIYQAAWQRQSQAFILMNLRGEKEPPEGFKKIVCHLAQVAMKWCTGAMMPNEKN